ncbi:hypothetical protein OROGR_004286 [Orobanche gracilis]
MFSLKIHTIDFSQPIHATFTPTTSDGSASAKTNNNLKPVELKGAAHLFRQLPSFTHPAVNVASISAHTTIVFVVAVPNYLSENDFLVFCGNHVRYFEEVIFLKNDGMEDRYSVLIRLESQLAADGFYGSYNGKRFKPPEVELCHLHFAQAVEYSDSEEIACVPPPDYTELPSCPVCLDWTQILVEYRARCVTILFIVPAYRSGRTCLARMIVPTIWIFQKESMETHPFTQIKVCRLCQQQDEKPACAICGTSKNPWICLICGFVGCGRYEKGHASGHWSDTQHHFSLELEKQQIWDYVGDKYVHRLNQSKVDEKSVIINSRCGSVEECGTCTYEEEEEDGLDGALFSSKIEGVQPLIHHEKDRTKDRHIYEDDLILDEYNRLLASQLDIQRQHYESLLAEAKSRKETSAAKAVEKAMFSKTHDLEYKLEIYSEEKKAVQDRNQELMQKQEFLQNKFKEIEERERSYLKSKDERILDLQEQIRDLKVYVEAQRMVKNMADLDDIRGGTVLPVEPNQSPSGLGNPKRRTKSGKRRS